MSLFARAGVFLVDRVADMAVECVGPSRRLIRICEHDLWMLRFRQHLVLWSDEVWKLLET